MIRFSGQSEGGMSWRGASPQLPSDCLFSIRKSISVLDRKHNTEKVKREKGYRIKGKGLIGSPRETATDNAVLEAWGVVVAVRGTAEVGVAAPPPAAQDARTKFTLRWTHWINHTVCAGFIIVAFIPILAPLIDIADHVVETKCIGGFLGDCDRSPRNGSTAYEKLTRPGLDPKSGPLSGGEILVHGNLVPLT